MRDRLLARLRAATLDGDIGTPDLEDHGDCLVLLFYSEPDLLLMLPLIHELRDLGAEAVRMRAWGAGTGPSLAVFLP